MSPSCPAPRPATPGARARAADAPGVAVAWCNGGRERAVQDPAPTPAGDGRRVDDHGRLGLRRAHRLGPHRGPALARHAQGPRADPGRSADEGRRHRDERPARRDQGRLDGRGRLRHRDGGARLPDAPAQPRRPAGADGARRAAVHQRPGDRRLRLVRGRGRRRDALARQRPPVVRREGRARRVRGGRPHDTPGEPARLAAARTTPAGPRPPPTEPSSGQSQPPPRRGRRPRPTPGHRRRPRGTASRRPPWPPHPRPGRQHWSGPAS